MFGAPFTAVGLFALDMNRPTSVWRSGTYAHFAKLQGLSGELTDWPGTADVDNAPAEWIVRNACAFASLPYAPPVSITDSIA
jgi:hypothetical protein